MASISDAQITPIGSAIEATLSPDASTRRQAEDLLAGVRDTPGFASILLQLIKADTAPSHIRQAAAVYLKNHVARFYMKVDWNSPAYEADRTALKAALVAVMLHVPVLVRRQLSEVLAIIAEHEYPSTWPDLVPELGAKLRGIVLTVPLDWLAMQGVLETLHAIFERYPWRERSNPLYSEINYSLAHSQEPVHAAIKQVCDVLHTPAQLDSLDRRTAGILVCNAELLCKIFYCLSWQELPPYFEENMAAFMTEMRRLLLFENPSIDDGTGAEPSCIDNLLVSVLDILNLYESKHDEEFRPYVQNFVMDTWQLLTRRANTAKNDGVVTTGIKFLTTVSRSPDYQLFSDRAALTQVCQQIVIPNIELRKEDEELFEDNPVEYVRRDMEGSDADTRRRGAVELVKGLCMHYESNVIEAFSSNISEMLRQESNWKQKDIALFIVTALGWKTGTIAGGVTETSSLIDVLDFFRSHVFPNLTAFASNPTTLNTPIFTADVIKFVISFRNQIPKENYGDIILFCVKLLGAREPVVQTYAAACIERLLSVKDTQPARLLNGNGHVSDAAGAGADSQIRIPRISKADIKPMLGTLIPAVLHSLQQAGRADEYLMRLLLRIITVAREESVPLTEQILRVTLAVLNSVIDNPANPHFNHFLFEVISALIRFVGRPETVGTFEGALLRPMQTVLERDVTELGPYVFQVLSQLMALHPSTLPQAYGLLMPPLLGPAMWERRGYIRGMVQYLETYVRKNSASVIADNQLRGILGIFNKLVASKATDHLGIQMVCTVIESYEGNVLEGELLNAIVSVLIRRLQAAKTPKYVQNLLYCLSLIVVRFGVESLVKAMDSLQPGLMSMLLKQVWIPEAPSILRQHDRRVCAIAMADIACATDLCREDPYTGQWAPMINATIALTEGIRTDASGEVSDDDDDGPLEQGESFSGGHCKLRWANHSINALSSQNSVASGVDARKHLAERISSFTSRNPGVFGRLLAQGLEQGAQAALKSYLASASLSIS